MNYLNLRQFFSPPRMERYFVAAGYSKSKTLKLYKANLQLSQAFHPLLGTLEVVLRNRINDVLADHFKDSDWIINQKTGFMSAPVLSYTNPRTGVVTTNNFLKKEVSKAERKLLRNKKAVVGSGVVSEQCFGFWTDLFEVHHYKLLNGKPIKIFTSLPVGHGRKEVIDVLHDIRRFRNRINHNEPICFEGTSVDFSQALSMQQSILSLLSWMDPKLIPLVTDFDKINVVISKAMKILPPSVLSTPLLPA